MTSQTLAAGQSVTLAHCLHHGAAATHMELCPNAPAGWRTVGYGCGCVWVWDRQVGAYSFVRVWP